MNTRQFLMELNERIQTGEIIVAQGPVIPYEHEGGHGGSGIVHIWANPKAEDQFGLDVVARPLGGEW